MKTKFFSLLVAVVLTAGYAQAQFHVGINVGLASTGMYGTSIPVFGDDAKIENRSGFQAGIVGEYRLGRYFAVQPGLIYATQGYVARMNYANLGREIEVDFGLNYLQVPIKALGKLPLGRIANLFLEAGPYVGYALNGNVTTKGIVDGSVTDKQKQKIEFGKNEDGFKRLDFGAGFGLGVQVGPVQVDMEYKLGLANLSSYSEVNMKNDCLMIGVSFFFGK